MPLDSDYISVPTDRYKSLVLDEVENFPAEHVLVTGYMRSGISTRCDSIDLYSHFKIPPGKKIISYFFFPFHTLPKLWLESYSSYQALIDLADCARTLIGERRVFLLVLVHPLAVNRDDQILESIKSRLSAVGINECLVTTAGVIHGAIYKQSFLIAGARSAALTEARALNKRVLRQDYVLKNIGPGVEFQKTLTGISIVSSKGLLPTVLDQLIHSPPQLQCELVDELLGPNFSKSGRNLYDQLTQEGILT